MKAKSTNIDFDSFLVTSIYDKCENIQAINNLGNYSNNVRNLFK